MQVIGFSSSLTAYSKHYRYSHDDQILLPFLSYSNFLWIIGQYSERELG